VSFQSRDEAVLQPASGAVSLSPIALCLGDTWPLFSASVAVAVGQPLCNEEKSLPDVRGADARSAQIGGPDGISHCFQDSA
tara:strand:- start:342 stop:584 length:243 start_codon:yes stop_codon:yes gene_type:complete